MMTLFSIPKPFVGEVDRIQRNAIASWVRLEGVQLVLLGDGDGVREAASAANALHIADIATNDHGTPRLDDAFRRVEEVADQPLRCFVNADIVLIDDFLPAVSAVRDASDKFLLIGATTDVEVAHSIELTRPLECKELVGRARADGRSRGATAIDYFVFTPGLFDPIPPFVVGRARFDNWLVWRARRRGWVVDASEAVLAIHQRHGYLHIEGGHDAAHFGPEAARNLELAGGKRHLFTMHDASHRLGRDLTLRRNIGSTLRMRESARKIAWRLGRR